MTPEEVLSHATTPCVSCLALGRETVGFPKKLGSPRLYHDIDTLVGTLDYGSLRIATATMGFKHTPLDTEDARTDAAVPLCIVKIGHSFDGTVTECRLVRLPFKDLMVTGAWSGPARLQLSAHALAPIADLPMREIVCARHTLLTAMQYGRPTAVHDYLA